MLGTRQTGAGSPPGLDLERQEEDQDLRIGESLTFPRAGCYSFCLPVKLDR